MATHQKRQMAPTSWPIPRKGTKFVVSKTSNGIPLLVVLRDIMQIAQNRREVKKALVKKDILICGKPAVDEKKSLELLDTLTIVPANKHYRVVLSEYGKFDVEEIAEKDSKTKVSKVIGKKTLAGKKIQVNLLDGKNYLSDIKCNVQDSVIVDLTKGELKKVLPVKEGAKVLAIGGKHTGHQGKITKIISEFNMVEIESEKKTFNALIKHILVLE